MASTSHLIGRTCLLESQPSLFASSSRALVSRVCDLLRQDVRVWYATRMHDDDNDDGGDGEMMVGWDDDDDLRVVGVLHEGHLLHELDALLTCAGGVVEGQRHALVDDFLSNVLQVMGENIGLRVILVMLHSPSVSWSSVLRVLQVVAGRGEGWALDVSVDQRVLALTSTIGKRSFLLDDVLRVARDVEQQPCVSPLQQAVHAVARAVVDAVLPGPLLVHGDPLPTLDVHAFAACIKPFPQYSHVGLGRALLPGCSPAAHVLLCASDMATGLPDDALAHLAALVLGFCAQHGIVTDAVVGAVREATAQLSQGDTSRLLVAILRRTVPTTLQLDLDLVRALFNRLPPTSHGLMRAMLLAWPQALRVCLPSATSSSAGLDDLGRLVAALCNDLCADACLSDPSPWLDHSAALLEHVSPRVTQPMLAHAALSVLRHAPFAAVLYSQPLDRLAQLLGASLHSVLEHLRVTLHGVEAVDLALAVAQRAPRLLSPEQLVAWLREVAATGPLRARVEQRLAVLRGPISDAVLQLLSRRRGAAARPVVRSDVQAWKKLCRMHAVDSQMARSWLSDLLGNNAEARTNWLRLVEQHAVPQAAAGQLSPRLHTDLVLWQVLGCEQLEALLADDAALCEVKRALAVGSAGAFSPLLFDTALPECLTLTPAVSQPRLIRMICVEALPSMSALDREKAVGTLAIHLGSLLSPFAVETAIAGVLADDDATADVLLATTVAMAQLAATRTKATVSTARMLSTPVLASTLLRDLSRQSASPSLAAAQFLLSQQELKARGKDGWALAAMRWVVESPDANADMSRLWRWLLRGAPPPSDQVGLSTELFLAMAGSGSEGRATAALERIDPAARTSALAEALVDAWAMGSHLSNPRQVSTLLRKLWPVVNADILAPLIKSVERVPVALARRILAWLVSLPLSTQYPLCVGALLPRSLPGPGVTALFGASRELVSDDLAVSFACCLAEYALVHGSVSTDAIPLHNSPLAERLVAQLDPASELGRRLAVYGSAGEQAWETLSLSLTPARPVPPLVVPAAPAAAAPPTTARSEPMSLYQLSHLLRKKAKLPPAQEPLPPPPPPATPAVDMELDRDLDPLPPMPAKRAKRTIVPIQVDSSDMTVSDTFVNAPITHASAAAQAAAMSSSKPKQRKPKRKPKRKKRAAPKHNEWDQATEEDVPIQEYRPKAAPPPSTVRIIPAVVAAAPPPAPPSPEPEPYEPTRKWKKPRLSSSRPPTRPRSSRRSIASGSQLQLPGGTSILAATSRRVLNQPAKPSQHRDAHDSDSDDFDIDSILHVS